jgi:hypothetical protein
MSRCIFGVGTHGQLGKTPHHVLGSMYRIGVGLDTSLILIHAISWARGALSISIYRRLAEPSFGGI